MSKATLHEISVEPAISPTVATKLAELGELVKDDKLSSVAIALVYRDGCTGSVWSSTLNMGLLIASVTRLQHRLLSE